MDYRSLVTARYSVRKFKPEHLRPSDLESILRAGQAAPTAVNRQPQRILVFNDDESCKKLKECRASQSHAPAALLVCYDRSVCWVRDFDKKESGEIDASIVTAHMMLAAADLGVGSVWVMHFDPDRTREVLRLPEDFIPVAFLMLGYPAEDAAPSPMHDSRYPLEKTVFPGGF